MPHFKGLSIYDGHTEGERGQAYVGGEGGSAPCERPKKLELIDVIVSYSQVKKLAFYWTRISYSDKIESGNISPK